MGIHALAFAKKNSDDTDARNSKIKTLALKYKKEGKSETDALCYARVEVIGEEVRAACRAGDITPHECEAQLLALFATETPISVKFDGFLSSVKRGNLAQYRFIFEGNGAKALNAAKERKAEAVPAEPWKPTFKVLEADEPIEEEG